VLPEYPVHVAECNNTPILLYIGTHIVRTQTMKTTIELSDALFSQAKKHARKHKTTLKALIEQGLRQVLAPSTSAKTFKLRDASVNGKGLNPEFREAGWEQLRDAIYSGQGA
jgi:hypothetical protein